MASFTVPVGAPLWFLTFVRELERELEESKRLESFVAAALPDPAVEIRKLIYISDESGGAVPAFSDGTDFRRVTDRAIVS